MKLLTADPTNASAFSQDIADDLSALSTAVKTKNFSALASIPPDQLADALEKLGAFLSQHQAPPEDLSHLRRLLLMLENHKTPIYGSADTTRLQKAIDGIADHIGRTPQLTQTIPLPASVTRPSRKSWTTTACDAPTRGSGAGEMKFLERDGQAAPRGVLLADAESDTLTSIEMQDSTRRVFDVTELDFYDPRLMHVDHFISWDSLSKRTAEMIQAMNDDPDFARRILDNRANNGYFVLRKPGGETKPITSKTDLSSGTIVGTPWLYLSLYNSMGNLWFLLASSNSGGGKVAADPIEWLGSFPLGQEYLRSLGPDPRKAIDTSDLLYRVNKPGNPILKDDFLAWVREHKKHEIKTYRSIAEFTDSLRSQAQQAPPPNHDQLRYMRDTLALLIAVQQEAAASYVPSMRSSSPSSQQSQQARADAVEATLADPDASAALQTFLARYITYLGRQAPAAAAAPARTRSAEEYDADNPQPDYPARPKRAAADGNATAAASAVVQAARQATGVSPGQPAARSASDTDDDDHMSVDDNDSSADNSDDGSTPSPHSGL